MRTSLILLVVACCCPLLQATTPWYYSVPVLPAVLLSSQHLGLHSACYNHSQLVLSALDHYALWAVQMLDSSAKLPPAGVVSGNLYDLGHFDQCLGVASGEVHGQYCLLQLSYRPVNYTTSHSTQHDLHVWEVLQETEDCTRIRRDVLHLGVCVPDSCTTQQLQAALQYELPHLGSQLGLTLQTSLSPKLCTNQRASSFSLADIVFCCLLGLLVIVVLAASCYARLQLHCDTTHSAVKSVLLCFAAQRNLAGLVRVRRGQPGLDTADGLKLLYMLGVILGHRLILYGNSPTIDRTKFEQFFHGVAESLLINGTLLVDFYFVASGVLLAYHLTNHLQEHKSVNLLYVLVIRLLRLTPMYMMVVFFQATVFYHMGSGPLWESTVGLERERCQHNWWTNLLYVNNYIRADNMCMFQSWYLSVDTQLFVAGLLLVYCIARWPCLGYTLLASLSTLSVLVPIFDTWWRGAEAFLMPLAQNTADLPRYKYFHEVYVRTENRAAPYMIGLMVGIVMARFKDNKFRVSKAMSLIVLLLLEATFLGSFLAASWFYIPGSTYSSLQAGLYASLSRVVFASSRAGLLLLVSFGSIDLFNNLFSWKPLRVLSRLVYGVYLVHTLSHLYHKGSLRTPLTTEVYNGVWMLTGDLVFSFVTSLLLTLLLESPVRSLCKLILQRVSPKQQAA